VSVSPIESEIELKLKVTVANIKEVLFRARSDIFEILY